MCEESEVVSGTDPPIATLTEEDSKPADVVEFVGGIGRRGGAVYSRPADAVELAVVTFSVVMFGFVPLEAEFAGEDQRPADAVEFVVGGGRRGGAVD